MRDSGGELSAAAAASALLLLVLLLQRVSQSVRQSFLLLLVEAGWRARGANTVTYVCEPNDDDDDYDRDAW